jgi:hypothetical protein
MVATPTPNRFAPRTIGFILGGMALAIGLFILLTPSNSWEQSGSTYNKAPDGYAAWYDYATRKGLQLTQSRQSIASRLVAQQKIPNAQPETLLQVQPRLININRLFQSRQRRRRSTQPRSTQRESITISAEADQWLQAGNNLVILGVKQPVQRIPFSSRVSSPIGPVVIETSRRAVGNNPKQYLADSGGAIVWAANPPKTVANPDPPKKGKLILASTPYLAANAYQDSPGNYAFLTDLLTQLKAPIVIDEHLHGYKEPIARPAKKRRKSAQSPNGQSSEAPSEFSDEFPEGENSSSNRDDRSIFEYFAQTPLLPIAVQSIVLLAIAIWARNRRFGRIKTIETPNVDNSQAYIRALAGSLRQANSRSFVIETVGQAELRQLQQQLGLGSNPMTLPEIIDAWSAQQQPTEDLKTLLRLQQRQDITDRELLVWLQSWQRLRQG